jgi:hypothetical protein
MERIVRGRSATLTHTFYSSATATDPTPDSATVTITRADGTVLVNAATATEAGTGKVTYTVTPAQTALLDKWTVDWVATFGGQSQTFRTFVEVAGDVLFTLSEARALKPLDNTTTYTNDTVIAMRTSVEQAIEEACGVAFVPRYELETVSAGGSSYWGGGYSYGPGGYGPNGLPLKWPKIRAVRSATDSGTVLTAGELAGLSWTESGILYGRGWTGGYGNVLVGYEHGWDRPPERIRRAALLLAKTWLVAGPVDDRTSTFSSVDGGTYSLVVPGRGGSIFGLPEVDAAVQQYSLTAGVA